VTLSAATGVADITTLTIGAGSLILLGGAFFATAAVARRHHNRS
jgi:hypothetical protein